ncbi:MAG: hypothetical protein IKA06_05995 [Clostridia bacterium]|nr:hypothetical protein [Clostridia bacterium]
MKKRVLSLLLCVCMIASTAVLFSSCGKKTVDFSNAYTVVYGSDLSSTLNDEVKSFAELLGDRTNGKIGIVRVDPEKALSDEAKYEILVGNTNRPETGKLLKKIKGQGYAIAVTGKKIVIVGTTNFLTAQALDYFSDTYLLSGEAVSSLKIEETVVSDIEMLEITNKWGFVYSSYLDDEADMISKLIRQTKSSIGSYSDVRGTAMFSRPDSESASTSTEILVGIVNREEVKTFLSGMDATNYGVGAKNGRLLICAYNDSMMVKAFEAFHDILRDSVYVEGEEKKILVPADFSRIYTDTENTYIITDFPRPQGLTLSGTIDVHSGSTEYCYNGEGVTAAAYEAYCSDLVKAGYVLYTDHTAESSMFRTYINEQKGMMIYAAFNAFAHAKSGYQKAIRIIVGPTEKAGVLSEDMLSMPAFTKLAASSITAIRANYATSGKGQLYVITLEDGSFIMVDGGASDTVISDRIYDVLEDLYIKWHGEGPDIEKPIRIAAWYVTHGHGDHVGAMSKFINKYCKNYDNTPVTIDTVIANFASDEGYYGAYVDKDANTTLRNNLAEYSASVKDKAPGEEPGFKYIKVHTGQKFWLANVECEVLYTHEDLYPNRMHTYNDSSTVIRMTLYHTENGTVTEESKTTFIWLGDAQEATCAYLRAMYGNYLKSDMVQVAHHIGTGSDVALYNLISPAAVWFPTDKDSFTGSITRKSTMIYKICNQVSSIQYVILSDVRNYTVSITESGANYTPESASNPMGVFSAGDGLAVTVASVGSHTASGFMKK